MLIFKIGILILIGIGIAEFSIWSWQKGNIWWLAPASAIVTYISFLSGLYFKDKDVWLTKPAVFVWNVILAKAVYTTIIFVLLLAAVTGGGWLLYKNWPQLQNFLRVQAFKGSPIPDNFMVGADVTIHTFWDEAKSTKKVDDFGIAEFELSNTGSVALTVSVVRRGTLQIGGVPGFTIRALPHLQPVNISDIPSDGWKDATDASPTPSLSMAHVPKSVLETPIEQGKQLGDPSFQADNAPWGVPAAEIIINRRGYVFGYDPKNRIPRWVSYAIAEGGDRISRRPGFFEQDPLIAPEMQASINDYRGSGYDRGGLVSFADLRFQAQSVVDEAAYLSVMAPQTPALNRRTWLQIEKYARSLTKEGKKILIIAGPAFLPETASGRVEYFVIGEKRVAVPTHFFRIIVKRQSDGYPEILGFLVPNNVVGDEDITQFITSLKHIEETTGLDLFPKLDPEKKKQLIDKPLKRLWD
jgi:endonuclease G